MNKINYTCTINDINNRLDFVLKKAFPNIGGRGIKRLCEQNLIKVNNKSVQASYKIQENDKIEIIYQEIIVPTIKPLKSDNGYTAFYKAPFIHTEKQKGKNSITLEDSIQKSFPHAILLTRLDYATSGIIMLCQNYEDFENWKKEQIQNKIIKKYFALVEGNIQENLCIEKEIIEKNTTTMQISNQSHSPRTTRVFPLAVSNCKNFSLVECHIFQGARHQIRVHLASMGFPLVGDKKYGAKTQNFTILQQLSPLTNQDIIHNNNYLQLLENQNSEKFILHHYQIQSKFFSVSCLPPFFSILPKETQEIILTKIKE